MIILNNELQPERMTVSDISSKFGAGEIFVDDDFQRRSVWVAKNKIRLIESILTGYPMPEVYFWQAAPDPQTGKIILSIVDGQQRIRAITEFIKGEFRLTKSALDNENASNDFAGKFFADLSSSDKNNIWNYRLNVRVIPYFVERAEIIRIFLRLNETDKSLNPQELRNAKFNGRFIQAAIEVADNEFWKKWSVFTPAIIRRMTDVLISSQFLAFLRMGIQGDVSPKAINALYDQFNDKYSQKNSDVAACAKTLDFIDILFSNSEKIVNFFKSQTHFYPLFIASYIYQSRHPEEEPSKLTLNLESFIDAYKVDIEQDSRMISAYRLASNEGMTKRSNREIRVNTVLDVLEGNHS